MAERRFAALAHLRRPAGAGPGEAAPAPIPTPPLLAEPRPPGRPPGKRSDPAWKPRTILMRTKTHRHVAAVLLENEDGPDLSELVDELLTDWLARQ